MQPNHNENITTVMLGSWCYFLTISLRPSNKYETLELLLYYMVCDDVLNKYCQLEKKKKEMQSLHVLWRQRHSVRGEFIDLWVGGIYPHKKSKGFQK